MTNGVQFSSAIMREIPTAAQSLLLAESSCKRDETSHAVTLGTLLAIDMAMPAMALTSPHIRSIRTKVKGGGIWM